MSTSSADIAIWFSITSIGSGVMNNPGKFDLIRFDPVLKRGICRDLRAQAGIFQDQSRGGVDFRHRGKIFRRSLSGAARYNNLRVGPRAPEPANVFSRGPNRFIRDGAAVDDDGSCKARLKRQSAHGFAFSRVKPAAEREDFISRGHRRAYVGQLPVKDKARR